MSPQQSARDRILRVAAELIHVQGVSGTSVEQVLKLSGTGKGQFYHYFDNKVHLVREVLSLQLRTTIEGQRPFIDLLTSWSAIRAWLTAVADQHERRELRGGCPIGSLAAEMADRDQELRKQIAAAFAEWESHLAQGLSTMKMESLLTGDANPAELAETTMAAIQGGYLLATVKRDIRPMRNSLDAAFLHLKSFGVEHDTL